MKKGFIITFLSFLAFSMHASDDMKKLKKAREETNASIRNLWCVSILNLDDKIEQKFREQARHDIRKEQKLEKQILRKRARAKL